MKKMKKMNEYVNEKHSIDMLATKLNVINEKIIEIIQLSDAEKKLLKSQPLNLLIDDIIRRANFLNQI